MSEQDSIDLQAPGLKPQTVITIAVDTDYVGSMGSEQVLNGIYMMDNRRNEGSQGECGNELQTVCHVGDLVAFHVCPVDKSGEREDKVEITGFEMLQGTDVFGSAGAPQPHQGDNSYWLGRALNRGQETYRMRLKVTSLLPTKHNVNVVWDPYITAQ